MKKTSNGVSLQKLSVKSIKLSAKQDDPVTLYTITLSFPGTSNRRAVSNSTYKIQGISKVPGGAGAIGRNKPFDVDPAAIYRIYKLNAKVKVLNAFTTTPDAKGNAIATLELRLPCKKLKELYYGPSDQKNCRIIEMKNPPVDLSPATSIRIFAFPVSANSTNTHLLLTFPVTL